MDNDEIISKNKKHFDRQWTQYDDLNFMKGQTFKDHLLKCTNSSEKDWKDKVVFEGGAGIGRNVIGALELGVKKITVTELTEGGVSAIRKNTTAHSKKIPFLYPANLCNLEQEKDGIYDIAFAINCIPHIPDYKKAISELVRITKPGGLIMFNVPPKRDPIIAKNDNAIRELSTHFDEVGGKIFSKIIAYIGNIPELYTPLSKVMEISTDELSAYDHFLLPYTAEFTEEEIRDLMKEFNCKLLKINDLISVKARKL